MVGRKIVSKGRELLVGQQTSVLSAATVIMVMVIMARVLGLVRQRILSQFFTSSDLSLFFAAFRLPDAVFEVLVFGAFSSAFIPVFTKALKDGERRAWDIASVAVNIGLLVFGVCALGFALLANPLYKFIAPGFDQGQIQTISTLARILFAAQGFFVISYVLTGVLESLRRFLIPALAPVFYNLGIILGTIFLAPTMGLMGPAIGVVIGALCHFLIQFPFAFKLGFRFKFKFSLTPEIRHIGKLSFPRILDISFEQIQKTFELYLSSLISTASYAYLSFANSLQLLPVGLFGASLAKAAFPTLVRQAHDKVLFKRTLVTTINQIVFLVLPLASVLIVLRIPLVRLIFGSKIFDWEATVQTGLTLSAFGIGIAFQSIVIMLERGFYALHDTKTPVVISLFSVTLIAILDLVTVGIFHFSVWGLAASFSFGVFCQAILLFNLLGKKLETSLSESVFVSVLKSAAASIISAIVMFFLLKSFDQFAWIGKKNIAFERFVLDTRYTFNLFLLTGIVFLVGCLVYLAASFLMRSTELSALISVVKKHRVLAPQKDSEPVTPEIS